MIDEMNMIKLCKYCGKPEYYGEFRWLVGQELCRECYKHKYEEYYKSKYRGNDLDGKRPTMEEYVEMREKQGFTVSKLSLDRASDGYIACRSILVEQRVTMPDCHPLQDELIHLQRDSVTGCQSKDMADSLAGTLQSDFSEGDL